MAAAAAATAAAVAAAAVAAAAVLAVAVALAMAAAVGRVAVAAAAAMEDGTLAGKRAAGAKAVTAPAAAEAVEDRLGPLALLVPKRICLDAFVRNAEQTLRRRLLCHCLAEAVEVAVVAGAMMAGLTLGGEETAGMVAGATDMTAHA